MTTNSPNHVDGDVQALNVRGRFTSERFLSECLKPEEISGEKQRARIEELMMWFDRYYSSSANPKWLRGHVAELCYYIMAKSETTPPAQLLRPVELPGIKTERSDWSAWNWIEHLGGRFQNGQPGDYIEFGSVYAVAQMLKQYRRTVTAEVIAEIADSLRQQGYEVKS